MSADVSSVLRRIQKELDELVTLFAGLAGPAGHDLQLEAARLREELGADLALLQLEEHKPKPHQDR